MRITIDLPPDLEQALIRQSTETNVPLQTLIVQTLRQLTQENSIELSQWSEAVLSYGETPDFPAFEFYRGELLPPHEPDLF